MLSRESKLEIKDKYRSEMCFLYLKITNDTTSIKVISFPFTYLQSYRSVFYLQSCQMNLNGCFQKKEKMNQFKSRAKCKLTLTVLCLNLN